MQKLKKIFSCIFSSFSPNNSHNNKIADSEANMEKNNADITVEQIESTISTLSKDHKISQTFLLCSVHARTPAVLRFSFKRAYQAAGMSDNNHNLTPFGEAVFQHIENEHAKTGKPKPLYLPQVVDSMSFD